MPTIRISPVSLLLGGVITTGAFLLMSQLTPASYGSWGPPKNGIVNLYEDQTVPLTVPAGGYATTFQVPNDRWLTVTSVYAVTENSAPGLLRWSELVGGAFFEKGRATQLTVSTVSNVTDMHSLQITPESAGGTVGWTFRPGSQVVIRNTGVSDYTVQRYSLIGYQTRD